MPDKKRGYKTPPRALKISLMLISSEHWLRVFQSLHFLCYRKKYDPEHNSPVLPFISNKYFADEDLRQYRFLIIDHNTDRKFGWCLSEDGTKAP